MEFEIGLKGLAAAALLAAALPAVAQDAARDGGEAEIDSLIDASATLDDALALARRQAGEADMTGAAATLERALLTNSEGKTGDARLYYVAVLCRLGDLTTAKAELEKLDGRGISNAEWGETVAACGPLQRPSAGPGRSREGLSGEVSAGLAYDADTAGQLLVQFDISGVPFVKDDGLSFVGTARIGGRADLGSAYLYAAASGVTKNALAGPALDYQILDGELGLGFQRETIEVSGGGVVRSGLIAGDRFVTELGGAGEVALVAGTDSRVSLRGEVVGQDYAGSTPAFSRDGTRFDLAVALQGRRDTVLNYFGGIAFERKTAETARTGYSGIRLFSSGRQAIGKKGAYGSALVTLRYVEYGDEAGFPPANEFRYYTRLALGVPLGHSGLALEAGGSYTARIYNDSSTLGDYSSLGGELRLVWAFGN